MLRHRPSRQQIPIPDEHGFVPLVIEPQQSPYRKKMIAREKKIISAKVYHTVRGNVRDSKTPAWLCPHRTCHPILWLPIFRLHPQNTIMYECLRQPP